jgi:hypothetical protein
MLFYVIGKCGVIQFMLMTGWSKGCIPPPDTPWQKMRVIDEECGKPMPADLGYHSPVPMYEGQTKVDSCEFMPDGCYYDGSSLNADRIFSILVHEGGDAVWAALEQEYHERFKVEAEVQP